MRFEEFIAFLVKSRAIDDPNEALRKVIEGMDETRKPGSITITINLKPAGDGQFFATGSASAKVPVKPNRDRLFYYDHDYRPSRSDTRQLELAELGEAREAETR